MRNTIDSLKSIVRILATVALLAGFSACGGSDDDGNDESGPTVSVNELYGETSRTWRLVEGKRIVFAADTSQEKPLSSIADCDLDDAHVFSGPAASSYQQIEGDMPCFAENTAGDLLFEQQYSANEGEKYLAMNGGTLADILAADTLMIEELTAERLVQYTEFSQSAGVVNTVKTRTELTLLPDPQ